MTAVHLRTDVAIVDPKSYRVLKALGVPTVADLAVPLWAAALAHGSRRLSVARDEEIVHWMLAADDERNAVQAVAMRDLRRAGALARELYATRDDDELLRRLKGAGAAAPIAVTARDPYAALRDPALETDEPEDALERAGLVPVRRPCAAACAAANLDVRRARAGTYAYWAPGWARTLYDQLGSLDSPCRMWVLAQPRVRHAILALAHKDTALAVRTARDLYEHRADLEEPCPT